MSLSLPAQLCPSLAPTLQHQAHAQLSSSLTDVHVNCVNEGHCAEQLEMLSVPTTVPVGELGAW